MTSCVHQEGEFLWRSAEAERDAMTSITMRRKRDLCERAGLTMFQMMGSGQGCSGKVLEKPQGFGRWVVCKC